jgi:hypothetical protein
MQGLNPLLTVSKAFDSLALSLDPPPDSRTLKSQDERQGRASGRLQNNGELGEYQFVLPALGF